MKGLLKRRWLVGALLLLVVIGAGYALVPVGEPAISQATCDRIHLGCTETRLEEILGYGNEADPISREGYAEFDEQGVLTWGKSVWHDEDGAQICVTWTQKLGVIEKSYTPSAFSRFQLAKRRIERRIRALWP